MPYDSAPMAMTAQHPYDERESGTLKLIVNFLLLSLLLHALLLTVLLLAGIFLPTTATPKKEEPPTVNLSLMAPPPPKPTFVPTQPQANVPPKSQPIESANDTLLTSKSTVARKPDSIMPDVTGHEKQPDLNDAPNLKTPEKPQIASTPPTPRPVQQTKPTPPQPQAQQQPQPQPKPTPKQQPNKPPTPVKPQPQVDPDTGLPVLPPLNAQTLAQSNPALAAQPLAPAAAQPQQAASVHGSLGHHGDNSPAAMATELGKYKQYVYSVVGSYWYPDIDKHFGIIPVGLVHIQFTIHSDGTLSDVKILEGDNLMILRDISKQALVAPAPFKPFSDAMIKQVGDSYTDDFSFSVY